MLAFSECVSLILNNIVYLFCSFFAGAAAAAGLSGIPGGGKWSGGAGAGWFRESPAEGTH